MEMRNLLHLPVQTVKDRQGLWEAWRALGGSLHQETWAQIQGGSVSGKDTPPPFDSAAGIAAMSEEYQRGLRRARTSLALLQLRGIKDPAPIEDAILAVSRDPRALSGWLNLSGKLAQAWKDTSR